MPETEEGTLPQTLWGPKGIVKEILRTALCPQLGDLDDMGQFLDKTPSAQTHTKHRRSEQGPIKEAESIINNLPKREAPGPDRLTGEFYQIFKEESVSILHNLFQRI